MTIKMIQNSFMELTGRETSSDFIPINALKYGNGFKYDSVVFAVFIGSKNII